MGQNLPAVVLPDQETVALLINFESDWVIPGNLPALRAGFWAWKFEDGSDSQKAEENWARCINLLNQEAKYSRGGGIPSTSFINWGVMGGCFGTGWTQPGLVSL